MLTPSTQLSQAQSLGLFLLLTGLLLQGLTIYLLLQGDLWQAFTLHTLTSLVCTWPLWILMENRLDKSKLIMLLILLLCFFIPLIAPLALLLSFTLGTYYTHKTEVNTFDIVEPPVIPDNIVENIAYTQAIGSNIRAILESSQEELERIRAVLATRRMNDQETVPILQIALLDPIDEVRLLAYSMLNAKEKKISSLIQKNLNLLNNPALSDSDRATKHHYIAEAYWELAYLGLEQGQAKLHVLEAANQHVLKALDYFKTDVELYFLRGRINLELSQYAETAENFRMALEYGMPVEKVAPYLAELAFAERRFNDVSQFMQLIKQSTDKQTLSNMVNQWL